MSESQPSELDLRAFLRILRRRLWVLILVPVIVTGASLAATSVKTPKYRSSAELLIGRTQAETIFNPLGANFTDPSRLLANQIRVLRSDEVTRRASDKLGFAAEIGAKASSTEDVITLSAVDVDAERAADIVNAYAGAYLDYRRSSGESENQTAQAELRRQIGAADARIDLLDQELTRAVAARREQVRLSQSDERQTLLAQLVDQRSQLSQLEAAANVERGGAQLLSPAKVPGVAFDPNIKRSGVLALVLGMMLGVALTLLLDYLDNRVRGEEDLRRVSGNLAVVGLVPTLPGWRNRKATHVISVEEPTSSVAEAYRALRTSIQFLGLDRALRTLQITSPVSGEGKTTTVVNLAVALARAGQRVVLVDCDLRRPRVHQFLGLDPAIGFTSVLLGDATLSDALQVVPDIDGLRVLPAGPVPPNPSELLSGRRTIEILATLQADADVVLIDSPPVLPVSDATALSTRVDGTLMVVNANSTTRKQLVRSLELLRQVEAVVVGIVLNRASSKRWGYDAYGYRYGYGYRQDAPATSSTRVSRADRNREKAREKAREKVRENGGERRRPTGREKSREKTRPGRK